jgi:sugar phosphate isomerase/epimerase
LAHDELVLSHFSLARHHPVGHRVALAARHGFRGIGLYAGHYLQLETEGFAPHGLRDLLEQHGVCLAEIEVVPGLGRDGAGGSRAGDIEAVAWRMADEFGCRYLQVIGPADAPVDEAAAAFGSLCDRAADHGLVVGLEFLPFTDIVSVRDARAIVEAAGRDNGGICVDVWHHVRGANDLAAIAALPGELITGIQLNDGPLRPDLDDYYTDCLQHRVAPGRGEFDLAAFLHAVRGTGCMVPMSLEVCSRTGWERPDEHVAEIAEGMQALRASGALHVDN